VIDMPGGVVLFSEVDEMAGDPVLDRGGVSGDVYCIGDDCDCSKDCNMIAVRINRQDKSKLASRMRSDGCL
jgi:hypothetical protein